MSYEIELNNEQKMAVLNEWNKNETIPPSISTLVKVAFPEIEDKRLLDGRSVYGRAVKRYLSEKDLKATTKTVYIPAKINTELSKEWQEYLTANIATMKPFEMAKVLYNNPKLSPASNEMRVITKFCDNIDPRIKYGNEIPENDYKPPTSLDRVVARIKKYVDETRDWDYQKLNSKQKRCCESLRNYLHDPRFKHQIDSYAEINDKVLFESSFVKYTYDKDDLTKENCDQYLLLCSEIIIASSIQKTINMLDSEQNRILDEDGKLSMSIVETIKNARSEYNDSIKRQQSLYKSLVQERSEKLNSDIKEKASLLNLVAAWKNYESRQQIIKLAEQEKEKIKKELHELENMDEMKYRLLGMSVNEILNG